MILLALLAAACPIDRAVYRLHGAPQFAAGFARTPHPSDVASDLRFFLKTPKRTYWFSFASANGYGGTALVPALSPHAPDDAPGPAIDPDTAPGRGIWFDAFREDGSALADPPRGADPAPAQLFARGLGPALWYEAVALAGGDPRAEAETMPIGRWERAGCAARPH